MNTNSTSHPGILLIGVGNEYRRDDGVGRWIARAIKAKQLPNAIVTEASGEGTALMRAWKDGGPVFLFDAVSSGAPPGTIYRLDAHVQPLPQQFFHYSTHTFSVAEAIELARALNQLPPHLIVYGIEGKTFEGGVGLSSEVEQAAREVVERVAREIQSNLITIDENDV
jgi:hydrogenase maturation protease